MQKFKIFYTLTGYQLTWLACVFGEKYFLNLGIYIGIIYLAFYFHFNKNKKRLLLICLSIAFPGYLFDSMMVYLSIYQFNSPEVIGILPSWMIILWLSFSTLFDEILVFFKKYQLLGIFFSIILGPLTYYLGEPIGIIFINEISTFFTFMIIFWFLLMTYYLQILLKYL
tara:strand:- start:638 stop:1144 length:507 start_codon:yes stop_codon:yes gene_type:complete